MFTCMSKCKDEEIEEDVKIIEIEKVVEIIEIVDEEEDVEIIEIKKVVDEEEPPNKIKIYKIHDDTLSFKCFLCEFETPHINLLHKHLLTKHGTYISNICRKCYYVFEHDYELINHETVECQPDLGTINKIPKRLDDYIEWTSYLETNDQIYEMSGDTVKFSCPVCKSKYVQFNYLEKHCDTYGHDDFILCYGCCYIFNTAKKRDQHLCVKITENINNKLQLKLFPKKKRSKWFSRDPEIIETTLNSDGIITRMNDLIKKLEILTQPIKKDRKYYNFKHEPKTAPSEGFNFFNTVNRVIAIRARRMRKEKLKNCVKRNLETKENTSKCLIENISKFLEDFDGPPNKKFKKNENENVKCQADTSSDDDQKPRKIRKFE